MPTGREIPARITYSSVRRDACNAMASIELRGISSKAELKTGAAMQKTRGFNKEKESPDLGR